jgi:Leucine-rich repeat (LRR) protein
LNRNQLTIITPIEKLKALKVLQLYHNRIVNADSVMKIMTSLPKLRELSLDGNPCASKNEFNYELLLRIPKLKLLNDDAVKEMDRDVAS